MILSNLWPILVAVLALCLLVTVKERPQQITYKSAKGPPKSPPYCTCYPFSYTHIKSNV